MEGNIWKLAFLIVFLLPENSAVEATTDIEGRRGNVASFQFPDTKVPRHASLLVKRDTRAQDIQDLREEVRESFKKLVARVASLDGVVTTGKRDLARHIEGHRKCQDGWLLFQGHCYYINPQEHTWAAGGHECRRLGGNYVKIGSDAEFQFIAANINVDAWIGLNDIEEEGTFRWLVDHSIEYTNAHEQWWHPYEPNDRFNGQDCIRFWFKYNKRRLDDYYCSYAFGIVCEKNL